MSRRNGDKARFGVDRKRRIAQRAKDRTRRAAAQLQPPPVAKAAKPVAAAKAIEPPAQPVAEQPVKKPRARKAAAPPAE
jgi:hypothetical protein